MARYDPIQAPDFADHSPVLWLHYDTAASGLTDWSRMKSDLNNFHTRLSQHQQYQPPTTSSLPSRSVASSSVFCRSWNNGSCAWPYGQCTGRYRHCCEKCEGEHPSYAALAVLHPSTEQTPEALRPCTGRLPLQ